MRSLQGHRVAGGGARRRAGKGARALLSLSPLLVSCTGDLPLRGEALLVVDTDMPVPAMVGRLRVDFYSEDGTWFESRDFPRQSPADWPTSFGVYSDDEGSSQVLVRLRAYPEGTLRDYRGERFVPRPVYEEPYVATSAAELCEKAPRLELGETIRQRRGSAVLLKSFTGGGCSHHPMYVGSTAAYVDVPVAGTYRFGAVNATDWPLQISLQIRRSCDDAGTALACDDGESASGVARLPSITRTLDPGRYYLLTGGRYPVDAPADFVLGAAREDEWELLTSPDPPEEELPLDPRLVHDGVDATPETEPEPGVTIDRLVRLRLEPDTTGAAHVTLRGACAGAMAQLGATPPFQRVVLDETRTCVDTDGVLLPLRDEPLDPVRDASEASSQGTFGEGQACPAGAGSPDVVCVRGGVFQLGSQDFKGFVAGSTPERAVVVSTFFLDRTEVTVESWRKAKGTGLVLPHPWNEPLANEHTLGNGPDPMCVFSQDATWGREGYALNCVDWVAARAYCLFRGGDLPTEAQWEYAASKAGKGSETAFSWGNEPPECSCEEGNADCHHVVFGRPFQGAEQSDVERECPGWGPLPIAANEPGDVGILGIAGLSGGASEWTLDATEPYDSPCWRAQPVTDPLCYEEHAPLHTLRGGNWAYSSTWTRASFRMPGYRDALRQQRGFRCAYSIAPATSSRRPGPHHAP